MIDNADLTMSQVMVAFFFFKDAVWKPTACQCFKWCKYCTWYTWGL